MNRRHCVVGTLIVTLLGVCSAGVNGQASGVTTSAGAAAPVAAAPGATAPVAILPAAYATPSANRKDIDDFISKNVANLVNDADPVSQAKSRENLSAAPTTAGQTASPEFQLVYGQLLNNAVSPKLNPAAKPTFRQRLNIAIVVARVAEKAANITLQETTVKLINDPTEPIVLWGLKAAQPQVKEAIKSRIGAAAPPVLSAIVPAVFAHPSGPVFEEAYTALDVTDTQVMGELLKLWGNRLAQYQAKDVKEAPDDPGVDARPVSTLSSAEMWKTVLNNKQQQIAVMQAILDQLYAAAYWADRTPAGDKHDQLVKLVRQCGEACAVIGIHEAGKEKLKPVSDPLVKLDPKVPATATIKLEPLAAPVIAEIIAQFPGVKPAQPIGGGAAGGLVAP